MRVNEDCIFCKIVAGKIPCTKVYEDERALIFMDVSPLNKGHLLVVPKEHFGNVVEMDPGLYGHLYALVCRMAKAVQASVGPEGMNVMQLNGRAGNQVVPHLHIHLVPRWTGDGLTICAWNPVAGRKEEIEAIAEQIKTNIL